MNARANFRYGRDFEVVQRLRPEPETAREVAAQQGIDDLEFEIFQHKAGMIALEGKETTMRLGASTAMRWGDVAFGIYTAQGDLAICATGIYHHAVLSQIPIKYIVKHWKDDPSVGLKEGDSFFYNDPFYGGVHNADMGLAIPVFADGELVCFIGAAVHTGECGGSEPGGMVNGARSRYDEGLLVTPIKIGEDFVLKEDILGMLANMTRDPRTMLLDIKARLAASRIAERRVKEIITEKGSDFFVGSLRRVLRITGEAARRKVSRLNDGIYRQPRFMDTTGPEDALLKINLAVEKRGDRIKLILRGSSPAISDRPINSYFQGIIGLAMVYFCGWFFHDLPANNGLLDAIEWEFDDNTLVSAGGDLPVSYAPATQVAFTQGMFMCGARMTYAIEPLRAVGCWYSGFAVTPYGGLNQWGDPVADITPEINATGGGGCPDGDGVDAAGAFFATMSDCGDVEATEADRPFLYLFRNFFNNSYGHGKFRGGAGVGFGAMVHGTPGLAVGGMGFGTRFPATPGIFGGRAAPTIFVQVVANGNMRQLLADGAELPHDMGALYGQDRVEAGERRLQHVSFAPQPLAEGDTIYVPVSGGAGYGDVLERDPALVIADLRRKLVTPWAARNVYRVAYDADTLRLDAEATRALRTDARHVRKARAKPYADFVREWSAKCPPAAVLRWYGRWPDPGAGSVAAATA
ncbi:hydantoinase B/oxoprolinase family protein [Azoarcus sp. L1K30]|uniref:hydantoinase B/oxoprolinase family protein n=1 Tax=Azoarcus sp. L1K30 TaxID=2820277 RepID=UPI001B83837C|nr:hydantoinase B/oxoprolinase family protein [Azoarcus sp. L1K30]MBR0567512.1 hydantoinase B/oxoprolinase family protein [Azoarcus sp. L1K30]